MPQLTPPDMPRAALVHRASFDRRLPALASLHTPDEDRGYWCSQVFEQCKIWGATRDDVMIGVIAFRADWVDQFYVLPAAQGCGVGPAWLRVAP